MDTDVMFSSKTDLWATPQAFYERLNKVFRFGVDVCALPEDENADALTIVKVGKGAAGRLLGGVAHDGYPKVQP